MKARRGNRWFAHVALVAAGVFWLAPVAAAPTTSNGSTDQLVGSWHGRSLCVTARPACTDETVLYRLARGTAGAESFRIEMNKIVGGEIQLMVVLACRFEALRQQLICPVVGGQWQLRWDGRMLFGALLDDQNGAVRFVQVSKDRPVR